MSENHVLFDFYNDSTSNNKKKQEIITTIEQPWRGSFHGIDKMVSTCLK